MLDIKFIRENKKIIQGTLKNKNVFGVDLDKLLEDDARRRDLIQKSENLRAEKNKASKEIISLKDRERAEKISAMKILDQELDNLEAELKKVEEEYWKMMYLIPNVVLEDVPVGKDESENKVIRQWGEATKFNFKAKDHLDLGVKLGLIDMERAAKVTGARFGYIKGAAAILELALINLVFKVLTSPEIIQEIVSSISDKISTKPFIPVFPPVMIKPEVFTKMARLNEQDKDERYYLSQDDLYLVGSAEHTLGSMHLDEILEEKNLPIRYIGFSSSFRREAGSYGKDTKGILRVHQFDKLEMESFSVAEDSLLEHRFFVAIQEYLVKLLKIPYQVVLICTGDMGKPDAHQIDIECYLPGQDKYRETHTADLMTDYQTRRLNTRVKRSTGIIELAHTNDATAFAIGRTLIAIMENYQQEDGSILVPEILRPYTNGLEIIK